MGHITCSYTMSFPVVFTLFYPKYKLKINTFTFLIVVIPQKLVFARWSQFETIQLKCQAK